MITDALSSQHATPAFSSRLSYPTARLLLGICYVGSCVTLAISALVLDLRSMPLLNTLHDQYGTIGFAGLIICLSLAATLPFDLIGGFLLPRHWQRSDRTLGNYARAWIRGAMVYGGIWMLAATALILSVRIGGIAPALLVVGTSMVLLIMRQFELAKLVGRIRDCPPPAGFESQTQIAYADSDEAAFSGGIVGLPGREKIVLPATWIKKLGPHAFKLCRERRYAAISTGLRSKGVAVAFGWNFIGLGAALMISGFDGHAASALVELIALATLWSFIGLLLLPSLTRAAVARIDRRMIALGYRREELRELAEGMCRLQDGEASRPEIVETVFHPLPALDTRLNELDSPTPAFAAWNASRFALLLAWPTLSLIPRAVHSNAGRPDLWVMGPVD